MNIRNASTLILTAVLCLVIGFAAGHMTSVDSTSTPDRARGEAGTALDSRTDTGDRSALAPTDGATGRRSSAVPDAPGPEVVADAARAGLRVARERDVDSPTGSGVITGVVRRPDGSPVAGATVTATPAMRRTERTLARLGPADAGRDWWGWQPVEQEVVESAERILEWRSQRAAVRTDAEGAFSLTGLEGPRWTLEPFAEGLHGEGLEAALGDEVALTLAPIGVYQLRPTLPDGSVPEDAVVLHEYDYSRDPLRWTREDPELRLEQRTAKLTVLAGTVLNGGEQGYTAEFRSDPTTIDVARDGEGPHEIPLRPMTVVRVTLLTPARPDGAPALWVRAPAGGGGDGLELPRVGEFEFVTERLAPGAHELVAGSGTGEARATTRVEITAGFNDFELELPPEDPDSYLTVTCIDSTGRPVGDVAFEYTRRDQFGGRSTSIRAVAAGEGVYRLAWATLVPADHRLERLAILASSASLGPVSFEVEEHQREAEARFTEPCQLRIEIVTEDASNAEVTVQSLDEAADPLLADLRGYERSTAVGPSGVVDAGRWTAGRHRIWLHSLSSREKLVWDSVDVDLRPGERTVTLTPPGRHTLRVSFPGEQAGARLWLAQPPNSSNYGGQTAVVGNDGVAVFESVPPGSYLLSAALRARVLGQMPIDVPCGTVTFLAAKRVAWRAVEVHEGGAGEAIGLRDGDVLLGSTERAADRDDFFSVVELDSRRGPVTLRVRRGGAKVELTLPGSDDGSSRLNLKVQWAPVFE